MEFKVKLIHNQPHSAIFFITLTLNGALPKDQLKKFLAEKELWINEANQKGTDTYNLEKFFFGKYDNLLDDLNGKIKWLENEECCKIIASKIKEFDKVYYDLLVYCILPNHVHILLDTQKYWPIHVFEELSGHKLFLHKVKSKKYPVSTFVEPLKDFTSKACNTVLKRNGPLWQNESYDHFIRDESELRRIIGYIIQNPARANLVSHWNDWKYTYISPPLLELIYT